MKTKSWRSEERIVKSTNVICDKRSKRDLWNGTDETQWAVLTRSKQMRSHVASLEQSFLVDEARCSSAFFLGHAVNVHLSRSSDEQHRSHSCLGTGTRVGTQIDRGLRDVFDDDDAVGGFVSMKTELHKMARKLAKTRDGEPRLALVRYTYDNVCSMLWSLALCCEREREVCPQGFRGGRTIACFCGDTAGM